MMETATHVIAHMNAHRTTWANLNFAGLMTFKRSSTPHITIVCTCAGLSSYLVITVIGIIIWRGDTHRVIVICSTHASERRTLYANIYTLCEHQTRYDMYLYLRGELSFIIFFSSFDHGRYILNEWMWHQSSLTVGNRALDEKSFLNEICCCFHCGISSLWLEC